MSHNVLFFKGVGFPVFLLNPSSIGLAGLVLFGYSIWPAILFGSFVSGVLLSAPPLMLVFGSIGNLLQAVVGAYILRKCQFNPTLIRLRDVLALTGVATFTTAIGPVMRWFVNYILHITEPVSMGFVWLGGILSTIIITPLIIRWTAYPQLKKIRVDLAELFIVFPLLIIVDFIISWTTRTQIMGFEIGVLPLAILLWIALRSGMAQMTFALSVTSMILLTGPFLGLHLEDDELLKKMTDTELYLILFAIPFYVITAISEERDAALRTARSNVRDLEAALRVISSEDQKKNDFIAVLGHELRNPLAPIMNYIEIMKIEGVLSSPFKDAVEGIDHQVKNIKRLLEDLLDISRITKGKFELKKEKVDIICLLRKATEGVRVFIDEREQQLLLDISKEPVYVLADPVRIEQIFFNLLGNAAKYTGIGGKIWVSSRVEEGTVIIKVRDNGVGISKEALPHVFTMFNQEDNSITRTHGGLGIGLAIVKMLVEMHGGNAVAESMGVNQGSEFTISIPEYAAEAGSMSTTKEGSKNQNASSRNILVVDDNPDMVRTLGQLLTLLGHKVVSAGGGEGAIKMAHEHKPDVILLDLGIPGMSGFDIARVLRREITSPFRLIAVSGYGQVQDKLNAIDAGFDQHLTKPVSREDIERLLA